MTAAEYVAATMQLLVGNAVWVTIAMSVVVAFEFLRFGFSLLTGRY